MQPLYPHQIEAVSNLKNHHHLICNLPTGSGKSRIFEQFLLENPSERAVLVSPLVALSRQQQARAKELKIESRIRIISPESLQYESVYRKLTDFKPTLLIVDEAHLIQEWGNHFRPSFRKTFDLLRDLKIRRSLWLSATLTDEAIGDIERGIAKPILRQGNFKFPKNLSVQKIKMSLSERLSVLPSFLENQKGQGILFVSTRSMADRLESYLKVTAYHAGLSKEERKQIEMKFKSGDLKWIVATSAFGMGIDMANLDSVVIFQVPFSMLTLVQMLGRVGRAEKPGRALVLWSEEDFQLNAKSDRQIFDALNSENFCEFIEKSLGSYCHQRET